MKKLALILFFVSFFLLLISVMLFYFINKPIQIQTFSASFNITEDIGGFDLNESALTFGRLRLRDSAMRNIIFYNSYPFPVVVFVNSDGAIQPFLSFDGFFFAQPNETKKIPFTIYAGDSAPLGFYAGKVTLEIKRSYKKDI
jgi:hypothetical protein